MTLMDSHFTPQGEDSTRAITKLVVMAVGGQGGGVLTSWIESTARMAGRAVQATSVAGVAQRTGATIYYIEIAPEGVAAPIFSLAPAAGDVDLLVAAELMEAGRAVQRGFVTPDRTTLIASTHRALAVSEKMVPGDGIADAAEVSAAMEIAARTVIAADMEHIATAQGSVISASLLGAVAASGSLPFDRALYEQAIRASGKGVDASLRAFDAGFRAAAQPVESGAQAEQGPRNPAKLQGNAKARAVWSALVARVQTLPEPTREMARAGLIKVTDFQDARYGGAYLDHLEALVRNDTATQGYERTIQAAKYIANAMAYDDVIRVADRKTRPARIQRIDSEMNLQPQQIMGVTEYFHPRAEEIAGLLPARLGARIEASPRWMARLNRWFGKGRRIRSDKLTGFVALYCIAGLRGYRPRTHRHAIEMRHMGDWLARASALGSQDYALGVQALRCRRLIKGYSDTHALGLSKFDKVLNALDRLKGRSDAADWARRLIDAALQDEHGTALDGALKTIASFTKPKSGS